MFTQGCFIRKNNQYLRDCLKELGYPEFELSCTIDEDNEIIVAYYTDTDLNGNKTEPKPYFGVMHKTVADFWGRIDDVIDCGTNDELFLAIAALKNDSDKYQLFKHNTEDIFYECNHDEFHMFSIDPDNCEICDHKDEFHKATVEELINHFKKIIIYE